MSRCDDCKLTDIEMPARWHPYRYDGLDTRLSISNFTLCLDGKTRCSVCYERLAQRAASAEVSKNGDNGELHPALLRRE